MSGERLGRPEQAVQEPCKIQGFNRAVGRHWQQPGNLAPALRHKTCRVEPGVGMFVLRASSTFFNVKRLIVVVVVLGILPMQRDVLNRK